MEKSDKHTIEITETVFRDAQQSLIATRMKTEDMIPVIEKMDKLGYWSFEMWGGATFDSMIRYLDEDPWERIKIFKKYSKKTKLQMLLRGQNLVGYKHYPDDIVERFIVKAKELGIDVFRIFDALNDIRNLEKAVKTAKKVGGIVQGAISYTISPVHTIDKYVDFAKELEDLGCDIITIKDMAGLITPKVTYELIRRLKKETNLPISLHSHCTTGLAPISYYAAMEAGVDFLDCAVSPFSTGTSQPPTETTVKVIKDQGFNTNIDLSKLEEIAKYFQKIKDTKYKQYINPISERVDINALIYQIPGGMMSNLLLQLKNMNALDKFDKVLEEIPRVRKDLGYVPLVTPTSQIIGTQAVLNVLSGERYKMVTQETKDLCRGLYGKTPAPIDPHIMKKIIGSEKPIGGKPADLLRPGWEKAKKEAEPYTNKEEEILIFALFPDVARKYFERKNEVTKKNASYQKPETGQKEYVVSINGEKHNVEISEL